MAYRQGCIIDNNFMIACLDQTTTKMLELLASLDKKVSASRRELDRDTFSSVPGPNVQAWISRTTMDSEEVEIRVESGEDGVLLAVLNKVRRSWSKQVRAAQILGH